MNVSVFSRFAICTLRAFNDRLYLDISVPNIQLGKHFGFLLFYLLSVSLDLSFTSLSLQICLGLFCPPCKLDHRLFVHLPIDWCVSNQTGVFQISAKSHWGLSVETSIFEIIWHCTPNSCPRYICISVSWVCLVRTSCHCPVLSRCLFMTECTNAITMYWQ